MGKYARPMIIGLIAGIAGGFLIKGLVFPDGPAPILYGLGIGAFVAYILSNLAGTRKITPGSAAERQLAMRMTAPAGKGLLIPYREGFVAKMAGLDLALDGKTFAQLTSPKFTCLVLTPGSHTLSAAFGGFAGAQSKGAVHTFEAAPGSVLVLRMDSQMGLVQGAVKFTPETDLEKMKKKLDHMQMASPDVAEI